MASKHGWVAHKQCSLCVYAPAGRGIDMPALKYEKIERGTGIRNETRYV